MLKEFAGGIIEFVFWVYALFCPTDNTETGAPGAQTVSRMLIWLAVIFAIAVLVYIVI